MIHRRVVDDRIRCVIWVGVELPDRPAGAQQIDRVLPAPGEGPDEAARERGHFRVELRATTGTGRRLLAVVAAYGDPGYAATAVMLGQSALCLAEDGDRLSSPGGVLTPAVAMGDALVERLRNAGMTLTIGTE